MQFSTKNQKAQTTTEYLFLAVGLIIFIILVYTLLQGGVVSGGKKKIAADVGDFLKGNEYLLFFDNFDSDSADQWSPRIGNWAVINKEYAQSDTLDSQKLSYAGKSLWVNYYADTKIQFSQIPATLGLFAGISARVNKVTGSRYTCAFEQTNPQTDEGTMVLNRYFSWDGEPQLLSTSLTFQVDTAVHSIGISVNGNDVKCYFDDSEKIAFTDTTPWKYGLISLDTRLANSHFDIVRVKYTSGPNPTGPLPVAPTGTGTPTATPTDTSTPTPTPTDTSTPTPSPTPPPGQCLDFTPISSCSTNQPYYCDAFQQLNLNCTSCGCPLGLTCGGDQNCSGTPSLQITNILEIPTNQYAFFYINWTTNFAANGTVRYGLTSSYGLAKGHSTNLTSHQLLLNALTNNTIYHYQISSCNATLCNTTEDLTFLTDQAPFCQESDGGISHLVYGNATNVTGTFYDSFNKTSLNNSEYYCSGSTLLSVIAQCYGWLYDPDNEVFLCKAPFCSDTGSIVTTNAGSNTDYCLNDFNYNYYCNGLEMNVTVSSNPGCGNPA
ncbi:hypothetical protein HY989_03275 [Candidatus Micrarchaeota archaeon]|nr:hypothetical protein [Candidatus Micrarchaeota archaeon]